MATNNKDFKVKNGLVVEGSNATVNGNQVLTETASDQYIIDLIGGETLITSVEATQMEVINGELNIKSGVFEPAGAIDALTTDDIEEGTSNKYYTDGRVKNVLTGSTQTNISISEIGGVLHITAENGVGDSTTDDLTEGMNNKYYSDSLVDNHLSGGDGINYSSGTISADLGTGLEISGGQIAINRTTVDGWYDASGAASTVAGNLSTHEQATTGIHGVTGNIVGTSDSQTLTNKTFEGTLALGSANTNDAYIQTEVDGAGDLTVHAGGDLTLSTSTGDIVLNPDGNAYIGSASAGNEIATNSYVDNAVSGLTWKQAVNLLWDDANATLTGSSGTLAIDGHAALTSSNNGYRILIKNGTNAGLWEYSDDTTNWTLSRTADADTYEELIGAAVYVMEGTQYGSTSWVQGDHYITNFTGQDWTQFSGQGSVTAGNGILVDGLEVSIDTSVVATQTNLSDHASDTSTHGVTGDIVGTSDSQSLSNKTIMGQTYFQSAGGAGGSNNYIDVNNSNGKLRVHSGYALDLTASDTVTVESTGGDIVLSADGNSYLGSATSGNEIATQGYVDNQTTDDVSEGSTNLYYTDSRARGSLSAGTAINYNSTSGEIAVDASQLDTDDIAEGATNHYYTDERAKDAAGYLLENSTQSNISISYDENTRQLTVTAEDGFAGHDTDDLSEGTTNLYFTDTRAQDAVDGTTRSFTSINLNTYRTEEATQQYVASASTVTAHTFTGNKSVKYVVRTVGSVSGVLHSQITELLATVDGNNNISVTEYGTVYTSENALSTATVDYSTGEFRLRVTTAIAGAEVIAAATIMSWAD